MSTERVDQFASQLCHALADVFTRTLASEWQFAPQPTTSAATPTILVQAESGSSGARLALGLTSEQAALLVGCVLGEPVPEDTPLADEDLQMAQGMVQEALSQACAGLGERLGQAEYSFSRTAPSWNASKVLNVRGTQDKTSVVLSLYCDSAFEQVLAPKAVDKEVQTTTTGNTGPAESDVNLSLLMDVELSLTLRFGSREMALKEISELSSGSIIELDKDVQEPVELLLDDRVVARGEVVMVDGNYGLRITELCEG